MSEDVLAERIVLTESPSPLSLPGCRISRPALIMQRVSPRWRTAIEREYGMAESRPVTIYGIKNCETMKKARAWLDQRGVAYAFHDYKASGIDRVRLEGWAREVGWEALINRAGTTFRKLPEKEGRTTENKAMALMLEQPSMIKRPVLDVGGRLTVGFRPE